MWTETHTVLCYISFPALLVSYTPCYFPSFNSLKSETSTNVNTVEGPLTYQHPLSNIPVPLPAPSPLYPCCLPWTVILKRHDIDRHINQWLSVALPPMPWSSKLAELQFLSNNETESHTSLSSFLIIGRNHLTSALPWCLDLSRLIKLLPPFFFLEWKPILEKKVPGAIKVCWAETLSFCNITNSLLQWMDFNWWGGGILNCCQLRIIWWQWHLWSSSVY